MKGELAALRAVARAAQRFMDREAGNDQQYMERENKLAEVLAKLAQHCTVPGCHESAVRSGLCTRHAAVYCQRGGAK